MIHPSSRMIKAPRIDGIAEMRVASPAARPVSRAVGRSVTAAGIWSLFLFGSGPETGKRGLQWLGHGGWALGGLPRDRETIRAQTRERGGPAAAPTALPQNATVGTFVLALHSHLPYARGAGRWPHGEEWIHEAMLGTYLPLVALFHDLREAAVPYRIVVGLTPVLIEQLADRDVDARFIEYADDQIRRAESDVRRFMDQSDQERAALADFY